MGFLGTSTDGQAVEDALKEFDRLDAKLCRLTFDSFEAAVNEFKLAVANISAARKFVSERDFESFYLPPSKTYIAMIPRGARAPPRGSTKASCGSAMTTARRKASHFPRTSFVTAAVIRVSGAVKKPKSASARRPAAAWCWLRAESATTADVAPDSS